MAHAGPTTVDLDPVMTRKGLRSLPGVIQQNMAAVKCSEDQWIEIQKAASEKRRELVLQGPSIDKKIVSGGLDVSIYSLSLLNYLEISQCPNLTEIHPEIANLINLQSLILCRNKLCSVPEAIGSLKSLKVLDVSVNDLTCLPVELSHLSELNTLNVSCNRIRSLPDGLSKCVKLVSINVSKNEISNLPEDLFSSDLEHLSTIIASENAIEELSGNIYALSVLKVGIILLINESEHFTCKTSLDFRPTLGVVISGNWMRGKWDDG